jgi:signal peptidase
VLLCAALALAVVVGAGAALGYRGEVILSGSMRPHLQPGDLVVVQKIAPAQMRVGDVVSFKAPNRGGITITHRVRSLRTAHDGRIFVVTRGDANNNPERWSIARSGSVGRVVATVPKAGYVTRWIAGRTVRLLLLVAVGAAMLIVGLRWAWRP